ncbi:hypothetical protein [Lentzea sp. CC55]|uniref:hypothetical protein n=1 Tax=Lentzea sp. CC55 TaxID=2884909 RepID=UPI001F326946|nr:hypothetical protein [Lentzea sp. CC55]MCG8923209.1 hypothetical protein [Lentzea sp. CC55]
MAQYACDETRRALMAVWETGDGQLARTVLVLPPVLDQEAALRLAASLTTLLRWAWRTCTYPASATESVEPKAGVGRESGTRSPRYSTT